MMAICTPEMLRPDAPGSERKLFAALKTLSDEWRIYHHVVWQSARNGRQGDGEADFVALHPKSGLLIIEVKGAGISIERGNWFTTNNDGTFPIKNPYEQAIASKYALIRFLADLGLGHVPVHHAVCFPDDSDSGQLGTYGVPEITWWSADLRGIEKAVARTHTHWGAKCRLSSAEIKKLDGLLAPTVSFSRRMVDEVGDVHTVLLRITDEQHRLFDAIQRNRRAVIQGGPGSGKTLLSIARARRLKAEGFRTLWTCYNELLAGSSSSATPRTRIGRTARRTSYEASCCTLSLPIRRQPRCARYGGCSMRRRPSWSGSSRRWSARRLSTASLPISGLRSWASSRRAGGSCRASFRRRRNRQHRSTMSCASPSGRTSSCRISGTARRQSIWCCPACVWARTIAGCALWCSRHWQRWSAHLCRSEACRCGSYWRGFASGFVSSSATIAAMGARAVAEPALLGPAVAGAVLSTVATVAQISVVVAATSSATALALAAPLSFAGVAAVLYGLMFAFKLTDAPADASPPAGEAFSFKSALMLATVLVLVLIASSALRTWFGDRGLVAVAAMAGFADVHATAISMATQVAASKMTAGDACLLILVGFTTNSITKIVLAVSGGSKAFALRVVPGLIVVLAAAWLGLLFRMP